MLGELGYADACFFAIHRYDCLYELGFAGEMMVDAGLADVHGSGDVGVTEAVIAPDCQKGLGAGDDFAGFVGEVEVHEKGYQLVGWDAIDEMGEVPASSLWAAAKRSMLRAAWPAMGNGGPPESGKSREWTLPSEAGPGDISIHISYLRDYRNVPASGRSADRACGRGMVYDPPPF